MVTNCSSSLTVPKLGALVIVEIPGVDCHGICLAWLARLGLDQSFRSLRKVCLEAQLVGAVVG